MVHQHLALLSSRLPGAREANYEEKSACRDFNPRPPECAIALRIQQLGGSSLLIPHLQIEPSSICRGPEWQTCKQKCCGEQSRIHRKPGFWIMCLICPTTPYIMRRYSIKVRNIYSTRVRAGPSHCVVLKSCYITAHTYDFVNVPCGGVCLGMCSFSANRGSGVVREI